MEEEYKKMEKELFENLRSIPFEQQKANIENNKNIPDIFKKQIINGLKELRKENIELK